MELIDTHSHLYLEDFNADWDDVVNRCRENQVGKILLPNIDQSTINSLHKTVAKHPELFLPMMGVHPCSIKENYLEELAIAETALKQGKYIAVGEIGLDYYWDTSFKEQQIDAFKTQINWAKELKLPIAIHCRDSFEDSINIVTEMNDQNLNGVFHCFSGTVEDAQQIISQGFYLGIGGVLTFKNSGLDEVIAQIDLQHLMLETDAPYLTPVPFRGKRNESSYVKLIAEKLAAIKNTTIQEVAFTTSENARQLFMINKLK